MNQNRIMNTRICDDYEVHEPSPTRRRRSQPSHEAGHPYGARPSTASGMNNSPGMAGGHMGYGVNTDFRTYPQSLPAQHMAVHNSQVPFEQWKQQLPLPMGGMDAQMQPQPQPHPSAYSPLYHMNLYSGAVPVALTHDSQLPTLRDFDELLNEYVMSLSEKKRDKALIGQVRYNNISAVLRDPKCTTIESAQFRFWAKKMFVLEFQEDENGRTSQVVMHEGKPVAIREQLFGILTTAHIQCQHGGRDKTSSQVRQFYSWVPKELIARFVRGCPSCMARRSPQSIRKTSPPRRSTPLRRTPPRVAPTPDTPLDYHNSPPQQQQLQPSAQAVVVIGGSAPSHHQVPQHAVHQEYHHFQSIPTSHQHPNQTFPTPQWV